MLGFGLMLAGPKNSFCNITINIPWLYTISVHRGNMITFIIIF